MIMGKVVTVVPWSPRRYPVPASVKMSEAIMTDVVGPARAKVFSFRSRRVYPRTLAPPALCYFVTVISGCGPRP